MFSAPVVETFRVEDRRRHPGLGSLGPDLCLADADLDECVERMARFGEHHQDIAEVLLDQRIACGVGNVYKSEVLWACSLDPFTPLGQVPVRVRRDLIATASRLLLANLEKPGRTLGRVRTASEAVPALWHADRMAQARRARPHHVLVPRLPAAFRRSTSPTTAPASSNRQVAQSAFDDIDNDPNHDFRTGRVVVAEVHEIPPDTREAVVASFIGSLGTGSEMELPAVRLDAEPDVWHREIDLADETALVEDLVLTHERREFRDRE